MKTKSSLLLLLGFTVLLFTGCNKSKRYSNKMDGKKWQVKEILIDGASQSNLPELLFKECDIYEESCEGSWISAEDGRSAFAWQFRDKGKTFELSNQSDHAHSLLDVKASEQCIAYSGVYEVTESKLNSLKVQSTLTNGFKGKTVVLVFEK